LGRTIYNAISADEDGGRTNHPPDEFSAARDYEKKMEKAKEEPDKIPPRRDLELDAIMEDPERN